MTDKEKLDKAIEALKTIKILAKHFAPINAEFALLHKGIKQILKEIT